MIERDDRGSWCSVPVNCFFSYGLWKVISISDGNLHLKRKELVGECFLWIQAFLVNLSVLWKRDGFPILKCMILLFYKFYRSLFRHTSIICRNNNFFSPFYYVEIFFKTLQEIQTVFT